MNFAAVLTGRLRSRAVDSGQIRTAPEGAKLRTRCGSVAANLLYLAVPRVVVRRDGVRGPDVVPSGSLRVVEP